MQRENTVKYKSLVFAKRIIRLYKYLCDEKKEFVMSKQLLRSGTSIGANVHEAVYGQSKSDFIAKMSIALKEASETEYWLELLNRTGYLTGERYECVRRDCGVVARLLTTILRSAKN